MSQERTRTIRDPIAAAASQRPGLGILHAAAPIPGDGLYPARPEVSIGRSPDCTIFFEDPGLSRFHATISFDGTRATLRDAGSHNGTFVDGVRIDRPTQVGRGSIIRCGDLLLTVIEEIEPYRGWRRWGLEGTLVGGPAMRRTLAEVDAFADSGLEVLVVGESGTGKELVARAIHERSGRRGPFIAVNCAAIPESLFEAELFGACRGAFTGATADRPGMLQAASGGTLFLDEVGDLPAALQAKLLRALEAHEVWPLGARAAQRIDLRLVAATNRDLEVALEARGLRADFYHRLRGALIQLPPLRDRREDIPLLIGRLLHDSAERIPPAATTMERLLLHGWPGNVRELDRVLREARARAVAESATTIHPRHLREDLLRPPEPRAPDERLAAVREALERQRGNVSKVAAELGLHRAQVYSLLHKHGIDPASFRGQRR